MFLGLKPLIVLAILAVLVVLRLRKAGMLSWALGWWGAAYVLVKFSFVVPVPGSVVKLYMSIVTISLFAYILSSRERTQAFMRPIVRLVLEPGRRAALLAVVLALPALVAYSVYARISSAT